jgi:hypothetical protein
LEKGGEEGFYENNVVNYYGLLSNLFESWVFSPLPFRKGGMVSPPLIKGRWGGIL